MTEMNEEGLKAARRFAQWHLGYPSWADQVIYAYLNPDDANYELDIEQEGYDD